MDPPAGRVAAWRDRVNWKVWAPLVVLALLVGGAGAWLLFAPKPSTTVDEPAPEGVVLRRGAFEGADGFHHASGTVALLRLPDGAHVLRFESYDARAGPDVFFWLTPAATRGDVGDVRSNGRELSVPGGFMGGQATLRGNFNLPLPADFDPDAWGGITAWCNRYGVLFNFAPLAPPA